MWITLALITALPLFLLIYLASLDGDYRVTRSLEIDAPVATVFAAIVDFKSWPLWSPWLMHEPEASLAYSDNYRDEEGYYSWDGKAVGAGKLTHVSIKPNNGILQRIEFLRPFKSTAEVSWDFEDRGDKTLVNWEIAGRMRFLFRFMTKQMEPTIGRDYELGLALLNGYLNSQAPHPEISFIGRQELEDFNYWSIPCNGNLRQLETARPSSIDSLTDAAGGKAGLALTLYHGFDPLAPSYRTEIAVPVGNNTPRSNYTLHKFGGGRYFQVRLHGGHRFIPLAWHALGSHCRMHGIKRDKSRPAIEIYHDNPAEVDDDNQIKTVLYLPVR